MEELMKNQMFATHAVAAAGSVTLGTALTYPLDTIKVLIQVRSLKPTSVCICMLICVCLTTAQVLDRVKTLSGHAGLYSGFGWLMLGRILGAGARFGAYEILTAFYKGCDALACAFASLAFGSIIMSGGTTFWFRVITVVLFYLATWEHYFTNTLIMPVINGPTEGLMLIYLCHFFTAILGADWWAQPFGKSLPFLSWVPLINEILTNKVTLFAIIVFAIIPMSLFNVFNVCKVVQARKGSMLLALAMVRYITTALMDAKLGTEGRKDLFDWLSRQLSGLSNFPDAVNLNYVLFQFVMLDGCDL
ncbi:hypothetical protein CsSME_00019684 [Camellia sinensis var. sinensis]